MARVSARPSAALRQTAFAAAGTWLRDGLPPCTIEGSKILWPVTPPDPPAPWQRVASTTQPGMIYFWNPDARLKSIYYMLEADSRHTAVPPADWIRRESSQHVGLHEYVDPRGSHCGAECSLLDVLGEALPPEEVSELQVKGCNTFMTIAPGLKGQLLVARMSANGQSLVWSDGMTWVRDGQTSTVPKNQSSAADVDVMRSEERSRSPRRKTKMEYIKLTLPGKARACVEVEFPKRSLLECFPPGSIIATVIEEDFDGELPDLRPYLENAHFLPESVHAMLAFATKMEKTIPLSLVLDAIAASDFFLAVPEVVQRVVACLPENFDYDLYSRPGVWRSQLLRREVLKRLDCARCRTRPDRVVRALVQIGKHGDTQVAFGKLMEVFENLDRVDLSQFNSFIRALREIELPQCEIATAYARLKARRKWREKLQLGSAKRSCFI